MTAATASTTWRKSSRSGTFPEGNCVEVAFATTCVRQGCDEAATTARDEIELCAFCAAEHDWFAEQYPIAPTVVSTTAEPLTNGVCPFCDGGGCGKCDNGTIWIAL